MRSPILALVLLVGCSDPFRPVDEGALWVLDTSDNFLADGLGLDGRGFLVGEQALQVFLRKLKTGQDGTLRESERFSVPAGREVTAGVEGVFDLRFTTHERGEGQTVDYRFAWAGGAPVEGTLDLPIRGVMGFLQPKGDKRYTLLLVALMEPR